MRIRSSLGALGLGLVLPMSARGAVVVNFHNAANGQGANPGGFYNALYVGQGAYSDPGNNIWNGFGHYPGPGSTYFYGPANPFSGNPGNPYAAYFNGTSFVTTSGPPFGSPGTIPPGTTPAGNATSTGAPSPVTLAVNYAGDNGATGNTAQGAPSFLLGQAAIANGANPVETFTLHNVPAGSYLLYLYGANYNNDRGTLFAVSSGTPDNGISATLNAMNGQPGQTFVEGQNFVLFNNVIPNLNGDITITASPNPADGVGNNNLSGETDVNGLQLVLVPEPASLGLLGLLGAGMLTRRRRVT
jgi:hypothetical protein